LSGFLFVTFSHKAAQKTDHLGETNKDINNHQEIA
jgi:hypothetical protein